MRRLLLFMSALVLGAAGVGAENYATLNDRGNAAYEKGDLKKALELYHQAEIERPETPEIYYNQANALIGDGKYEEALEKYQKALNSPDVALQARTHYNAGNGQMKKQDYVKAIESYKAALELVPTDMDAKYNLELARTLLKEQLKPEPRDRQQQQPQENQQEKQDQKQPQEKPDEQQNSEPEKRDQMQQPQKQPKPDEMSREDAMRILRAMEDSEKDTQKNVKRFKGTGNVRGKDW